MSDETIDVPRQSNPAVPEVQPLTLADLTGEAQEPVGLDEAPAPAAPAPSDAPAPAPDPAPAAVATPAPTPAAVSETAVDVVCPGCGTAATVYASRRTAYDFCRSCDYPLFWAVERTAPAITDDGDSGVRRLPGTAGRSALAAVPCPACAEPNPPAAVYCGRCGAELRPAPVVVVKEPVRIVAEPPPPPEPEPTRPWWLWPLVATLVLLTLAGVLVAIFV